MGTPLPNAHGSSVGYHAQLHDDATGDVYLRNRNYQPGLGRFRDIDPIGLDGGLNMYGYCAADPVNCWDPMGTEIYINGKLTKMWSVAQLDKLDPIERRLHSLMSASKTKDWHFVSEDHMVDRIKKWKSVYAKALDSSLVKIQGQLEIEAEKSFLAAREQEQAKESGTVRGLTYEEREIFDRDIARTELKEKGYTQYYADNIRSGSIWAARETVDQVETIADAGNATLEITTGHQLYEGYLSEIGNTTYEGVRRNESYSELYWRQADIQINRTLYAVNLYAVDKLARGVIRNVRRPGVLEISPRSTGPATPSSKRLAYMGKTPGKWSRTGLDVLERMAEDGAARINAGRIEIMTETGRWIPIEGTDMSHIVDAVKFWNEKGRFTGPKSPEIRRFMLDPDNYILEESGPNRARGAAGKERYLPPGNQ